MTRPRPSIHAGDRVTGRRAVARVAVGLVLVVAVGACGSGGGSAGSSGPTSTPSPSLTRAASGTATCVKNEQGTGCLPLAPEERRVDLGVPAFSRPVFR